jgi:hypothetical protein
VKWELVADSTQNLVGQEEGGSGMVCLAGEAAVMF